MVPKTFILLDKFIYKIRKLSKIIQNILVEIYLYKLALPKKNMIRFLHKRLTTTKKGASYAGRKKRE